MYGAVFLCRVVLQLITTVFWSFLAFFVVTYKLTLQNKKKKVLSFLSVFVCINTNRPLDGVNRSLNSVKLLSNIKKVKVDKTLVCVHMGQDESSWNRKCLGCGKSKLSWLKGGGNMDAHQGQMSDMLQKNTRGN